MSLCITFMGMLFLPAIKGEGGVARGIGRVRGNVDRVVLGGEERDGRSAFPLPCGVLGNANQLLETIQGDGVQGGEVGLEALLGGAVGVLQEDLPGVLDRSLGQLGKLLRQGADLALSQRAAHGLQLGFALSQ